MAFFGTKEYWEEQYSFDPEPYDWLQRYIGIKDILSQLVKTTDSILHVGCGNSKLAEEMYNDGYINSTNIDISQVVIKDMQEKYQDKPTLRFLSMDVREMNEFSSAQFDAVIDKGTLDSILCGEDIEVNAQKMLSEISRILKQSGIYIIISYGEPNRRLPYLEKQEYEWNITIQELAKLNSSNQPVYSQEEKNPPMHYVYVCKKGSNQWVFKEILCN